MVYTLLTLLSAVTLSFQIVSTKVVAQQETAQGKAAVYRFFHRTAWGVGILVALLLIAARHPISNYLNLPDPLLVALAGRGRGLLCAAWDRGADTFKAPMAFAAWR